MRYLIGYTVAKASLPQSCPKATSPQSCALRERSKRGSPQWCTSLPLCGDMHRGKGRAMSILHAAVPKDDEEGEGEARLLLGEG